MSEGDSGSLLELAERLCASADLGQVLASAHQHLARTLAAADAALGVSAPDDPSRYDWHVADLPEAFFHAYPDLVARPRRGWPTRPRGARSRSASSGCRPGAPGRCCWRTSCRPGRTGAG